MRLSGKQKKYLKKHLRKHLEAEGRLLNQMEPEENRRQGELRSRVLEFSFWTWLGENKYILLAFAALVFLAYANSLPNGFVSDDIEGILNNKRLTDFSLVLERASGFFQPLVFFLTATLFGKLASAYRLVSILFHLGTVILAFLGISLLSSRRTAIIAASLFAVHPILTEAVSWISGSLYVYYAFFFVLALVFFIFALKDKKYLFFSFLAFFLSLVSSEKAIVFPIVLSIFIFIAKDYRLFWKIIFPFFGLSLLLVLIRFGGLFSRIESLEKDFYTSPQVLNPLIQIPIALSSYLQLIVWPKNLTLYHSEMTFTTGEYLFRLAIILFLAGTAVFNFFKNRQVFFWGSFFVISLLPTLTPLGISWIVAERYVYLGTLGVLVIVALILEKLLKKVPNRVFYFLLGILVLLLAARTIVRNLDWQNQDTLWLATASVSPSSPQNHNNLGDLYGRRGEWDKAVAEFKKAIELKPNYADAYHNLANTYLEMGKTDLAIASFEKAIFFNPRLWQSFQNLASIFFQQNDFTLAAENLQRAVAVNPPNANLYFNLGVVYLKMNDKDRARTSFTQALLLDPNNLQIQQILSSF